MVMSFASWNVPWEVTETAWGMTRQGRARREAGPPLVEAMRRASGSTETTSHSSLVEPRTRGQKVTVREPRFRDSSAMKSRAETARTGEEERVSE
jgi:hypothetical protein